MAVNMQDTANTSDKSTNMRKRKRGYGEYFDEDTGEVTIVQTTKQAKRNHQKSGKWYKEPTEQEIRAWDREEQKQAAAERAAQREENKKLNAVKRAEQEAKDEETKRRMFEAGKITFTQTLAKKDEDQLNLHSWFGGRPRQAKPKKLLPRTIEQNANNGQTEHKDDNANRRTPPKLANLVRSLSHESIEGRDMEADQDFLKSRNSTASKHITRNTTDPQSKEKEEIMDQGTDLNQGELDLLNSSQDFDIAEDSDAETEVLEQEEEQIEQDSYSAFKVPLLPQPNRLPFSPVSQSELNVRATQALKVSSFKDKLAQAEIKTTSSTQAVRDIISGLCTQDLTLDLDEEEPDKENEEPSCELAADPSNSPTVKRSSPLKQVETMKPVSHNQSFVSQADSFDYDNAFTELEHDNSGKEAECPDEFDDCDLDDDFLSRLPLTQMVSSAQATGVNPSKISKPHTALAPNSAPAKTTRTPKEPFKKYDSFAVEGLEDDDLLEGLEEYERSQKRAMTPATLPKQKRVLPWDKQSWIVDTTTAEDTEAATGTQDTEVI